MSGPSQELHVVERNPTEQVGDNQENLSAPQVPAKGRTNVLPEPV